MADKIGSPSTKTLKSVFMACGGLCAFEKCPTQLLDSSGVFLAEICHINSPQPNGPRHDPLRSKNQHHVEDNLIILCPTHHSLIDKNETYFTDIRLRAMKRAHERFVRDTLSHHRLKLNERQVLDLSAQLAEQSVDLVIIADRNSVSTGLISEFHELQFVGETPAGDHFRGSIRSSRGDYRVVLCVLRHSDDVRVALATASIIATWLPRFVIVCGLAAGMDPGSQSLGDIVVGSTLTSGFEGVDFFRPMPELVASDPTLLAGARSLARFRGEERANVHIGTILSIRGVVSSVFDPREVLRQIIAIDRGSASAAAATAFAEQDVGMLSVRAIADFNDSLKRDNFHEDAGRRLATYLRSFVEAGPLAPSTGDWPVFPRKKRLRF
ncbi:hypothetical protein M0654_22185 [Rhizobium sp. NTR19]|uniref:Nucleoside phosphorylase domain-containing protein n=1 Tax=Neorhizobium turbinariae TaxID=2937795 RepID=A0ABT0IXR7_9HYPH|nr:hypothetical protein [Neorhizobium turbinariae]MCK8782681.1 hypothetical protein [Neorhizobium turbinariae]